MSFGKSEDDTGIDSQRVLVYTAFVFHLFCWPLRVICPLSSRGESSVVVWTSAKFDGVIMLGRG